MPVVASPQNPDSQGNDNDDNRRECVFPLTLVEKKTKEALIFIVRLDANNYVQIIINV